MATASETPVRRLRYLRVRRWQARRLRYRESSPRPCCRLQAARAGATPATGRVPSGFRCAVCSLQIQLHDDRVLTAAMRRIITASGRNLVEAGACVQPASPNIRRPHLEIDFVREGFARELDQELEHVAPEPAALPPRCNAQVEQMSLVSPDRHHAISYDFAREFHDPAMVTRIERVLEIAARPRMRIDLVLDRNHHFEIIRCHATILRQIVELRAHASPHPQPFPRK